MNEHGHEGFATTEKERSQCSNSSFYLKTCLMTSLLMKLSLLSMAMLASNHNKVFTSKISIPSVACHFKPTCLSSLNLQLFHFLSLKIETFKQDSHILKPYIPLIVLPCFTAIRPWCHSCPNITNTTNYLKVSTIAFPFLSELFQPITYRSHIPFLPVIFVLVTTTIKQHPSLVG